MIIGKAVDFSWDLYVCYGPENLDFFFISEIASFRTLHFPRQKSSKLENK